MKTVCTKLAAVFLVAILVVSGGCMGHDLAGRDGSGTDLLHPKRSPEGSETHQYLYAYLDIGDIDEEKLFCDVTSEGDFADNVVLVVLNIRASTLLEIVGSKASLKTYNPSDFPEINCVGISELTLCVTEQINEKLATVKFQNTDELSRIQLNLGYDIRTCNRIFSLELGEPGKENVLAAIRELEKRADILCASPNGFTSIF